MSGPYRVKPRVYPKGAYGLDETIQYQVIGPDDELVWEYVTEFEAKENCERLRAAYAAGQAGGVLEGLEMARAKVAKQTVTSDRDDFEDGYMTAVSVCEQVIETLKLPLLPPQTSTRDGGKESV
jgi:hypothetical protein